MIIFVISRVINKDYKIINFFKNVLYLSKKYGIILLMYKFIPERLKK